MSSDPYLQLLSRHLDAENAHLLPETLATLSAHCVFDDKALGRRFETHDGAVASDDLVIRESRFGGIVAARADHTVGKVTRCGGRRLDIGPKSHLMSPDKDFFCFKEALSL